jgi:hypothetical protein
VTTVGATQMTDKYLPICGQQYSTAGTALQNLPQSVQLDVQCSGTGETGRFPSLAHYPLISPFPFSSSLLFSFFGCFT